MLRGQFGVRVLPRRHRVEDVTFGQDADASVFRVDHDGGADPACGHYARRLPQRVRWPDGKDEVGHAVSYLHE